MLCLLQLSSGLKRRMSLAHSPAIHGGLAAAVVSSLFREPASFPLLPCLPEDIFIHWQSLLVGILIGLLLGQVLEWLVLLRVALSIHLHSQGFWLRNLQLVRQRGQIPPKELSQVLSELALLRDRVSVLESQVSSSDRSPTPSPSTVVPVTVNYIQAEAAD